MLTKTKADVFLSTSEVATSHCQPFMGWNVRVEGIKGDGIARFVMQSSSAKISGEIERGQGHDMACLMRIFIYCKDIIRRISTLQNLERQ